jgi:hypothetical protein
MSEHDIQTQIVEALRYRGVMVFSVPNELLGKMTSKAGYARMTRYQKSGLTAGVSDLIAVLPGRVIFMEVKTDKGKQSDHQQYFQDRVTKLGHQYHIVRSVDDALAVVGVRQITGGVG